MEMQCDILARPGLWSFDVRSMGFRVGLEHGLHPRNMPFAVRLEKINNFLFEPQVHGLLGRG